MPQNHVIDRYIKQVLVAGRLDVRRRIVIEDEIRDHVMSTVRQKTMSGADEQAAVADALVEFGSVADVGRMLRRQQRREMTRATLKEFGSSGGWLGLVLLSGIAFLAARHSSDAIPTRIANAAFFFASVACTATLFAWVYSMLISDTFARIPRDEFGFARSAWRWLIITTAGMLGILLIVVAALWSGCPLLTDVRIYDNGPWMVLGFWTKTSLDPRCNTAYLLPAAAVLISLIGCVCQWFSGPVATYQPADS
jgi:hypothetical protein